MTRDFSRLLRPRSIAVMGGAWASNVVEQCLKIGFSGPIWPINPSRATMHGLRVYRSLADLPEAPDAVFVGVNREATLAAVAELAAMGAGGAIVFASGWGEVGEAALQDQLVTRAGAMPILGPNCYGLLNYLDGVALWPDQHGGRCVARGVAIVSQSSNIAMNLTMQRRGLPIAYVACLGNAAQVGLAELASAFLADDRVSALGLYIEGVGDAEAFAAMAEAAHKAGKGIVAIKSGKTVASRAAAATHTAALAGSGSASVAFLAQCGVAEVATPAELVETLKLFHVHGPSLGPRLCVVACSGGEAAVSADLAAERGLALPPPSPEQAERLAAELGPRVTIANPLDYQTFIWGDEARTSAVFTEMLSGYDVGAFIIDLPRADRCDPASFRPAFAAIEAAQARTGKPALAVASLPETMPEDLAEAMLAKGLAALGGLETALGAIRAAQTPLGGEGWRPWPALSGRSHKSRLLDEAEAKAILAASGISVPRGVVAEDLPTLTERAKGLRRPLAIKGLGFAHKTEKGAVRLAIEPEEMPALEGVRRWLAEEMVTDAVAEVLIGAMRDPVYGVTLTIGMGGTEAELLADTETLIAPVRADDIRRALRRLKLWPRLDGYRGRRRGDVEAVIAVALAVQNVFAASTHFLEVEINPLLVCPRGAVAVDALIRVEDAE